MKGKDNNNSERQNEVFFERRRQREAELSSADIMKILRKRAAKAAEKRALAEVQLVDRKH